MHCHMRSSLFLLGTLALLSSPVAALAATPSFTDVPVQNDHYAAIEYLKNDGVLSGYDDGTFRPEQPVNRAEATKLIVAMQTSDEMDVVETGFADVQSDAWFAPYVGYALRTLRIIDGPPQRTTFVPQRNVTRAEFLKMYLLASGADPLTSFGDITFPLSDDAASAEEWHYPYMRYALAASMIEPSGGELNPGQELTRGDVADILYYALLYHDGKRTQALLSATETDVLNVFRLTEAGELSAARQAAGRAVVFSRGALAARPDDSTVKAAVKTAEGTVALVNAAMSLADRNAASTVDAASTAWHLGQKAQEFSSSLNALSQQLQNFATKMADAARSNGN